MCTTKDQIMKEKGGLHLHYQAPDMGLYSAACRNGSSMSKPDGRE